MLKSSERIHESIITLLTHGTERPCEMLKLDMEELLDQSEEVVFMIAQSCMVKGVSITIAFNTMYVHGLIAGYLAGKNNSNDIIKEILNGL